jgi:5-methylcytosine-specific restriction protein A
MPWAPRHVCAEPGCPELVAGSSRCARHARVSSRNHYGVPRAQRGHGSDYERVRRTLLGQPCHWCGRPSDTADYRVPVSMGGTLDDLVPACASCNYARGAAARQQLAEARRG